MAIKSGIAAQLGLVAEASYGAGGTPSRFLEFNSEGLAADIGKLYSMGLGRGRHQRSNRVTTYVKSAAGPLELDVMTKGFGLVLEHCLGQNTVAQVGVTAEYTQTIVPDPNGLQGKSLVVQVGRPDVGGTVRPFTYTGGKVKTWTLSCELDAILKLALELDCKGVTTATALASPSYPTGQPFVFTEGALTIGGSAKSVSKFALTGDNALDVERRFLGNEKKEPVPNAESPVTGELDAEFEDLAAYAAFVAGTQAQLVLVFTSTAMIEGATPFKLTITVPAIEYTGSTPTVGGPEVVRQALPFKALYNGTNPIVTVELRSSDTAA